VKMTKHSFWPNCNYSELVFWSKIIYQRSFHQGNLLKEHFNQESFNQESSDLENQLTYNNLIKKNPKTVVAWSKVPVSNTISKG
jgi:hypothetical protein